MRNMYEDFKELNPELDDIVIANHMMEWFVNRLNKFDNKYNILVAEIDDSFKGILLYHGLRIIMTYRQGIKICSTRKGLRKKYYKKESTKWIKRISKRKLRYYHLYYNSDKEPNVLFFTKNFKEEAGIEPFIGLSNEDIAFIVNNLYPEGWSK